MRCGFWNVRGWHYDINCDKHKLRSTCLHHCNLDIVGVAETKLSGNAQLEVGGFKWFGHNRAHLHKRAPCGSGGVGFLVRQSLLEAFDVSVLDDSVDGILWLRLSAKEQRCVYNICVCYLPPEGSTRSGNPQEFFDNLLSQVYMYQNEGNFYICGDVNSRCGDMDDFLEGVDDVPGREVIDHTAKSYGQFLCEFLWSANCCMLNGRGDLPNDFTSFAANGQSVVDYCFVPHEALESVSKFRVRRPRQLFQDAGCVGVIDPERAIPDHALLTWDVDISVGVGVDEPRERVLGTFDKYKLEGVDGTFMGSQEVRVCVRDAIAQLQSQADANARVDTAYELFQKTVLNEMNVKLEKRTVVIKDGVSNKKRKIQKPWWTEHLTLLWNDLCDAEKAWRAGPAGNKGRLKAAMRSAQKDFDKHVQGAKRCYWQEQQDKLMDMYTGDTKSFWKHIGQLGVGQRRKQLIPMEVLTPDGQTETGTQEVLDRWQNDFSTLLNAGYSCTGEQGSATSPCPPFTPDKVGENTDELSSPIDMNEVVRAVQLAHTGKACGHDGLPAETLKNGPSRAFMCQLFNVCFEKGCVPSSWKHGIIAPIPKCATKDPRVPTNYRGITLTSAVYKVFCTILNNRLTRWVEQNELLQDNQNGFRKGRSCVDHLSSLSMILETRKQLKKSTYCAFIDLSKAYDSVNREFLWHKLSGLGVDGKFLQIVKAVYQDVKCAVKVNGVLTDWFSVHRGLRQGCILSPLFFNMYLNDLAVILNMSDRGVLVGDKKIPLLLYADDIVLLGDTEQDLQDMLDIAEEWTRVWGLAVNVDKTNVVHFRPVCVPRSMTQFKIGEKLVQVVDRYKYLGLVFGEFLDYGLMAKSVSMAAHRALGLLIAKDKAQGGMPVHIFTRLYDTLVQPIIDYGVAIWGQSEMSVINTVQNRASRYFLGVGKYTPVAALRGDLGWSDPKHRQWMGVSRQWLRLCNMTDTRLNKQVFLWAHTQAQQRKKNWVFRAQRFYRDLGMANLLDVNSGFNVRSELKEVDMLLSHKCVQDWHDVLGREGARRGGGRNKLRTYRTFKNVYAVEPYVKCKLSRRHRRALAQFRAGVAPIRIETGRYEGLPEEQRLCPHCSDVVESEFHVILKCTLYNEIRESLFRTVSDRNHNFVTMDDESKFGFLLSNGDVCGHVARALYDILEKRLRYVYT